jgi:hypothetical protein
LYIVQTYPDISLRYIPTGAAFECGIVLNSAEPTAIVGIVGIVNTKGPSASAFHRKYIKLGKLHKTKMNQP